MLASFSSFLPHETCYLFNNGLMWLHGLSDGAIAIAYYAIPLELLYFTRNRRDLPFPLVFIAFGVFILGCGTTHIMKVVTLWIPAYWLSGSIKAITAIASVGTAILTLYIIPRALTLRSPVELENLNRQLSGEIRERRAAEAEVIKSRAAMLRHERIRVADQLASGIAHDLNNTLNVVRLRLNLIEHDAEFAQKHRASLQAMDRAVHDATRRWHECRNWQSLVSSLLTTSSRSKRSSLKLSIWPAPASRDDRPLKDIASPSSSTSPMTFPPCAASSRI